MTCVQFIVKPFVVVVQCLKNILGVSAHLHYIWCIQTCGNKPKKVLESNQASASTASNTFIFLKGGKFLWTMHLETLVSTKKPFIFLFKSLFYSMNKKCIKKKITAIFPHVDITHTAHTGALLASCNVQRPEAPHVTQHMTVLFTVE